MLKTLLCVLALSACGDNIAPDIGPDALGVDWPEKADSGQNPSATWPVCTDKHWLRHWHKCQHNK